MKRWSAIILIIPAILGCNKAELVEIVDLGATEKEIFVQSRTTDGAISLVTNLPYEVEVAEGGDFLTLAGSGLMPISRTEIPFHCDSNPGFRRTAKVTLSSLSRTDTVYVRQEGALSERVSLFNSSFN